MSVVGSHWTWMEAADDETRVGAEGGGDGSRPAITVSIGLRELQPALFLAFTANLYWVPL